MDDVAKLYGIKSCDTCRKAKQAFVKAGKELLFIDVRETPLEPEILDEFARIFADSLVNRKSLTWRNLSESERKMEIPALVAHSPTVMKRPVIVSGNGITIGWDAAAQNRHLGNPDSNL
ncbi:MAG: arsenate reductase [Silicimonas sp.]|nr:arsenate reductase [Silicimonas sp.]